MEKAAEDEEVAFDFGRHYGTHIGVITDYDGEFYQVKFDDGDWADWDAKEYQQACRKAYTVRLQERAKTKRKVTKKVKPNTKQGVNPNTRKVIKKVKKSHDSSVTLKVGDTYSFKLTDESYKGLEEIAKELGWWTDGLRVDAKKFKTRISRGDIFINKVSKIVARVMSSDKEHTHFGCLTGTIIARPFVPTERDAFFSISSYASDDFQMTETIYAYVRPSDIVVVQGEASGLVIAVDIERSLKIAASTKSLAELYRDENANQNTFNLNSLLGSIPMFADELPLVEQAMVDFGNAIEKSPIVHPEIAGREVEYDHRRAAYFYSSRCQGHSSEMESLVYRAYSTQNIPQELAAKFERRCNDYQCCYRMGVLSKDLKKMRAEIKTHRNMRDYHVKFINSSVADDDTDVHILNCKALSKILPQKLLAFSSTVTSPIFPCVPI
jgi:hypothetical protein